MKHHLKSLHEKQKQRASRDIQSEAMLFEDWKVEMSEGLSSTYLVD